MKIDLSHVLAGWHKVGGRRTGQDPVQPTTTMLLRMIGTRSYQYSVAVVIAACYGPHSLTKTVIHARHLKLYAVPGMIVYGWTQTRL